MRQPNLPSGSWRASALLLLALAPGAFAQGEPKVSAQLSSGVLRLGETAYVTVTVENAAEARIAEIPAVEGLELGQPGRPRSQDFTQWINGRVYRQVSLSWGVPLRGKEAGDYEIPPFVVEVAGKRLETARLRVQVVVDLRGEDLGFLEIQPQTRRVIEGQPFTVELTFGWNATTQIDYADLALPWWSTLPGALELEESAPPPDATLLKGVTVNREVEVVCRQLEPVIREGREFSALKLTKTYLPSRAGKLEFPTSTLEFGELGRSRSIFDSRPVKRESYFVRAEPFELEVVPLPTEGQPLDFSGAVGTFSARASADTRDVVVGDSIKLTVEWTGRGNLEFFRAPDLARSDAFRGFRVYGSTEEKGFERRKVTYDIAPQSTDVVEIPPVSLSMFDPEGLSYGAIATEPIPIRVRPLEKAAGLAEEGVERFEQDVRDLDTRPLGAGSGALALVPGDRFVLGALLAVPPLALLARAAIRRRIGDRSAPIESARRRARRTLARSLASADSARAELEAFHAYLAARTRESERAWASRDFAHWSRTDARAGRLPPETRKKAEALLTRLEGAVYGGAGDGQVGREALVALADELERVGL